MLILLAFLLPASWHHPSLLGCPLICNQYIKGFVPQAQPGCNSLFQQVLSCAGQTCKYISVLPNSQIKTPSPIFPPIGFYRTRNYHHQCQECPKKTWKLYWICTHYALLLYALKFCTIYRLTDPRFMAKDAWTHWQWESFHHLYLNDESVGCCEQSSKKIPPVFSAILPNLPDLSRKQDSPASFTITVVAWKTMSP